jgi:DNA-binding beta-propeller fold protein YncE
MNRWHMPAITLLTVLCCSSAMNAQTPLATVPLGANAMAIGFNPETNEIYAVGGLGNSLTEIDGFTFQTTSIPLQSTGSQVASSQIAVNPVTNTI